MGDVETSTSSVAAVKRELRSVAKYPWHGPAAARGLRFIFECFSPVPRGLETQEPCILIFPQCRGGGRYDTGNGVGWPGWPEKIF